MTCRNCKYWTEYDDHYDLIRHSNLKHKGICELARSEDGKQVSIESKAYAIDVEEYCAILVTNADFYCNQWVDKANEQL